MTYLIAIICSPLALLLEARPVSAVINLVLWLLSIVFWATIIFAHLGFVLWVIAFVHAVVVIHTAHEDRRARWIASAMRDRV